MQPHEVTDMLFVARAYYVLAGLGNANSSILGLSAIIVGLLVAIHVHFGDLFDR